MEGCGSWFYMIFFLIVMVIVRWLLLRFYFSEDDQFFLEIRRAMRHNCTAFEDRQGNIFTISDDASVNGTSNRYADFFYLEPSSEDSARIRSQQEKDDKDLPSYEEVMGISNATVTTSTSATAINAAEPPLDVPPYSVTDPNTMAVIIPSTLTTIPVTNNAFSGGGTTGQPPAAPSTSRAAAAATSTTVLALPNSVSNMSV